MSRFALLGDLLRCFRRGPAKIVIGDTLLQAGREWVELKGRLGLGLSVRDLLRIRTAVHGIDASRRYAFSYQYVYAHIRSRLSPDVLTRLGEAPIFPPGPALFELTRSFDERLLPRTLALLDGAGGADPSTAAGPRPKLRDIVAADGEDVYGHFTRCAWALIYSVAFKMPTHFLPLAIASIPRVGAYLRDTSAASSYYDVLVEAPPFLRVMIYVADANRKGHSLDGAHIPFTEGESSQASGAVDGYLRAVLGEETARRHVFFSDNRDRLDHDDPLDVQALDDAASARHP